MKKNLSTLLLCLLPFLSYGATSIEVDSIYEEDPYFILMGEADKAISMQNWPEAAARLSDAISIKPNNPTNALLLNNLASVYTYMSQDSLALATYDRALEIAPAMVTVSIGRAKLLLNMGRDNEAFDAFSRIIELDSISTTARYYHGMMALYSGNREIAEADFQVLKEVTPNTYDTALALSTLYSLTGREREAIPYLQKLIEFEPAAEYFAALAGCWLAMGELNEASDVLSRAFKSYPNDPELYYYRAWLNRDRYLYDDAQADAAKAISLGASPARVKALFEKSR